MELMDAIGSRFRGTRYVVFVGFGGGQFQMLLRMLLEIPHSTKDTPNY